MIEPEHELEVQTNERLIARPAMSPTNVKTSGKFAPTHKSHKSRSRKPREPRKVEGFNEDEILELEESTLVMTKGVKMRSAKSTELMLTGSSISEDIRIHGQMIAYDRFGKLPSIEATHKTMGCCACCGRRLFYLKNRKWYTLESRTASDVGVYDHIYPACKGWLPVPGGLQLLCAKCNSAKSDEDPFFFSHRMWLDPDNTHYYATEAEEKAALTESVKEAEANILSMGLDRFFIDNPENEDDSKVASMYKVHVMMEVPFLTLYRKADATRNADSDNQDSSGQGLMTRKKPLATLIRGDVNADWMLTLDISRSKLPKKVRENMMTTADAVTMFGLTGMSKITDFGITDKDFYRSMDHFRAALDADAEAGDKERQRRIADPSLGSPDNVPTGLYANATKWWNLCLMPNTFPNEHEWGGPRIEQTTNLAPKFDASVYHLLPKVKWVWNKTMDLIDRPFTTKSWNMACEWFQLFDGVQIGSNRGVQLAMSVIHDGVLNPFARITEGEGVKRSLRSYMETLYTDASGKVPECKNSDDGTKVSDAFTLIHMLRKWLRGSDTLFTNQERLNMIADIAAHNTYYPDAYDKYGALRGNKTTLMAAGTVDTLVHDHLDASSRETFYASAIAWIMGHCNFEEARNDSKITDNSTSLRKVLAMWGACQFGWFLNLKTPKRYESEGIDYELAYLRSHDNQEFLNKMNENNGVTLIDIVPAKEEYTKLV